PVQPIHVDIREDWANRPALGRPAQGRAVSPVLEVSGPEEVLYQPEEAVIGDAFAKDVQQDLVIDIVETSFDVTLDEPLGPVPHPLDTLQGGVAPAPRPETEGVVGELRFVVRLQNGADHILQELIRPCRDAERPRLPIPLRDVDPTHRGPSIALMANP